MREWTRKHWPPTTVCGAAFAVLASFRIFPAVFQSLGTDTPTGRLVLGILLVILFLATVVGARNDKLDRADMKKQVVHISDDVKAIRLALDEMKGESFIANPKVKLIQQKISDTERAVIQLGGLLKLHGVGTVTPPRLKGAKPSVEPSERDPMS